MRYLLLASLALLLNACTTNTFVATPVPEEISKVTYTKTDSSGNKTWQLDNNTLNVRYIRLSNNGQLISQRVTKATPNEFNIIATGLEKADFITAISQQSAGPSDRRETLIVETANGTREFTQDSQTRFPSNINQVTKTIPQLF